MAWVGVGRFQNLPWVQPGNWELSLELEEPGSLRYNLWFPDGSRLCSLGRVTHRTGPQFPLCKESLGTTSQGGSQEGFSKRTSKVCGPQSGLNKGQCICWFKVPFGHLALMTHHSLPCERLTQPKEGQRGPRHSWEPCSWLTFKLLFRPVCCLHENAAQHRGNRVWQRQVHGFWSLNDCVECSSSPGTLGESLLSLSKMG